MYVLSGIFVRKMTKSAVGWDLLPHREAWAQLLSLVADGARWTGVYGHARARRASGYAALGAARRQKTKNKHRGKASSMPGKEHSAAVTVATCSDNTQRHRPKHKHKHRHRHKKREMDREKQAHDDGREEEEGRESVHDIVSARGVATRSEDPEAAALERREGARPQLHRYRGDEWSVTPPSAVLCGGARETGVKVDA